MSKSKDDRIRVMIVDDHSIVRVGLKQVLEQSGEFEVVGQAADGLEAVKVAAEVLPQLIVMDVIMPDKGGVEACREIMEAAPETRVVMLTASTEEDAVVQAVAAGATGYLQKETNRDALLSALRGVASGELRLPIAVVRRVFGGIRDAEAGDAAEVAGLTRREREILRLLRSGHVLRADSGGAWYQAGDGSKRRLRHPRKAGCQVHARACALGRTQRLAGRLWQRRLA